ncbi:MARS [Bugula neritina]|uniref:Methionine--tRNA ligase, cytoplasmic n=1 Tax=Bugula neritina TaxID=10212 RepID=A0A7J7KGJ3_BUGNE|nr:MARS [Bugula neritina]
MFLRFSKGDPGALKPVLAAELASKSLQLDSLEANFRPALLCDGADLELFSMNAASCYLLGAKSSPEFDRWLEWEATELSPLIHLHVVSCLNKKEDAAVKAKLLDCLTQMENSLITLDQSLHPVLWCTLFSLVTSKSLPELETSFVKVSKWYKELAARKEYVKAVRDVFTSDPLSVLKATIVKLPLPDYCLSNASTPEPVVSGPAAGDIEAAYRTWCTEGQRPLSPRQHPVLPDASRRNVLITSALPYVNNVPHLGNIIGCVLSADVFSRFCRLRGYNSLYICGTDEYGTATETKAVQEGLTPEEICEKYYRLHSDIYKWFNIDFDHFGRTTTSHQTKISQDIFWKVYKNGYISKDSVEQLRCEKCERFLADRFVEGTCPLCGYEDARGDQCDKCGKLINAVELINPKCKLCKSSPVVKSSNHLFLDLSTLTDKLSEYLAVEWERGTWSHNAKVITKAWLRDGLKPRCITRDLKWGTPVPLEGFTDKVFYVWFDAPIGYISITANYTDQWEKWWKNPQQVETYNFMAKDNVPFHSVVFPCTQLGADDNYSIVNHLCATEYLNYENDKFSKSRGVGVFGNDAQSTGIPADIWRFYLLYMRPESQDSTFSWDDFLLKNNSELLSNLGNFVNRALKFIADFYGGVIPEMEVTEEDKVLLAQVTAELESYVDKLEVAQLRDGIWHMLSISRLGNQYLQSTMPWKLYKSADAADKARAASVVGIAANIACLLSLLIHPYMPEVSQTMRDQLNIQSLWQLEKTFTCNLKPGHKIGKPSPLFAKIEPELISELKKRFSGTQATRETDSQVKVTADPAEAKRLAAEVESQASKVRELKASKAEKSKVDEEVVLLLQLKKQLLLAEGKDPSEQSKKSSSGKKKKK